MPVPPVESQRHTAHSGLDEAPGHEELLGRLGAAIVTAFHTTPSIPGPHRRVFPVQIQGFGQPTGGQHPHRLLLKSIHRPHHPAGIKIAPQRIKTAQQGATVLQPVERNIVQHQVGRPPTIRLERRMRRPQKPWFPRIRPWRMPHLGR